MPHQRQVGPALYTNLVAEDLVLFQFQLSLNRDHCRTSGKREEVPTELNQSIAKAFPMWEWFRAPVDILMRRTLVEIPDLSSR